MMNDSTFQHKFMGENLSPTDINTLILVELESLHKTMRDSFKKINKTCKKVKHISKDIVRMKANMVWAEKKKTSKSSSSNHRDNSDSSQSECCRAICRCSNKRKRASPNNNDDDGETTAAKLARLYDKTFGGELSAGSDYFNPFDMFQTTADLPSSPPPMNTDKPNYSGLSSTFFDSVLPQKKKSLSKKKKRKRKSEAAKSAVIDVDSPPSEQITSPRPNENREHRNKVRRERRRLIAAKKRAAQKDKQAAEKSLKQQVETEQQQEKDEQLQTQQAMEKEEDKKEQQKENEKVNDSPEEVTCKEEINGENFKDIIAVVAVETQEQMDDVKPTMEVLQRVLRSGLPNNYKGPTDY